MNYAKRPLGPRNEYRRQEGLRSQGAPTLSTKFKQLKSLSIRLRMFDSKGSAISGELNCQYNLAAAKSVLRFDCPNGACVGGDFDLSDALAEAVAKRLTTVSAEHLCRGWRDKNAINSVHCDNRMRYKMTLTYERAQPVARAKR